MKPILASMSERDVARFWERVIKGDGCWPWIGGTADSNRGTFWLDTTKTFIAPRVSWALANGRDPDGMVCHSCDNPNCVNPDHLWIGTNTDNQRDASDKKRFPKQRQTHCKHGHPFDAENTATGADWRSRRPTRRCIVCRRAASLRSEARRRRAKGQATRAEWLAAIERGEAPLASTAKLNAAKTHCKAGHPYSGDNLIVRRGQRVCRACDVQRKRLSRERARKAAQ